MRDAMLHAPLIGAGLLKVGLALPAQADGAVAPELINLVGNLGIVGVLVWHLWYHTTHSYPAMQRQYAEQAEKLETTFTAHVNRLEKTFVAHVERLESAFTREQDASREHNHRETTAVRQDNAELRNMLIRTMESMRTAVHDVKDTVNAQMSKDQLLAEQLRREAKADRVDREAQK